MKTEGKSILSGKYTVWINILIILAVAFVGIWIVYISTAIFTKHGESATVPKVENMSYTNAVKILHDAGFNVDIRDSVFRDDIQPGFVIEQFPKSKSIVKPGRKIFLYINAVHPKEVIVDDSNNPSDIALKGWSFRQAMARLNELGFKKIRSITVRGEDDRVVKVMANGKAIRPMQKVPVNADIIVAISDGTLSGIEDSFLFDRIEEFLMNLNGDSYGTEDTPGFDYGENTGEGGQAASSSSEESATYEEGEYEEPEYF